MNSKLARYLVLAAVAAGTGDNRADAETSILDGIWAAPKLYSNNANPTLQSFELVGRYHGQYWAVRADQGDAEGWENRRMIAGFSSRWFKDFIFQAQMYIATDQRPYYNGLYEAFVEWAPQGKDFALSIGRLDYLFTGMERSTSSKKIVTVERGLLVNQIMPGEVVGAHAHGRRGKISYQLGVFSGDIQQEFSQFDNGSAAVIGVGYDTHWYGMEGSLHLDYLYNGSQQQEDNNTFEPYRQIVSLWHRARRGRLGMGLDITLAQSATDGSSPWSITLEPTWRLLDRVFARDDSLELALRYQYANSDDDNGLQLQRRYEQEVTSGEGNRYQAVYSGLNYHIYAQKLKLMLGGEYARMDDAADDGGEYLGWSWFGAVRLYF